MHVRSVFGRANLVPDVDRYRLTRGLDFSGCAVRTIGRWSLVAHPNTQIECDPYNDHRVATGSEASFSSTIVVILESPHKFEFLNREIDRPIAPACGVTGVKIQDVLLDMLLANRCVNLVNNTRVIIANPIPFQTSLYSVYDWPANSTYGRGHIRDKVWLRLWEYNVIRFNFLDRIRSYCPSVVINACTARLRPRVSEVLRGREYGELYETGHPSNPRCWNDGCHVMYRRDH